MSLVSRSYPPTTVFDGFIQSYEQERLREKAALLVTKATTFFNNFIALPAVSYTPTETTSPVLAIKNIFENTSYQGVCIGELHTHWSPKKVLIELLPETLVDTIYSEHLKKDEIQDCLDRWQEDKNMALPAELRSALNSVNHKYGLPPGFSYADLAIEAKKFKIRLVAIDTSTSAAAGVRPNQPLKTKDRIIAMNYTAKKIIDIEQKKRPGKFIILTGVNHSSKLIGSEVPGLSELMQCPCLIISDTTRFKKEPAIHNNPLSPKLFGFANEPKTVHSIMIVEKPLPPPSYELNSEQPSPYDKAQEPQQR